MARILTFLAGCSWVATAIGVVMNWQDGRPLHGLVVISVVSGLAYAGLTVGRRLGL